MSHTLLHHHGSDLQTMLLLPQLSYKIDLVGRPLVFKNCYFCFEFNLKGMKLPNFQKIVFFWISTFNSYT